MVLTRSEDTSTHKKERKAASKRVTKIKERYNILKDREKKLRRLIARGNVGLRDKSLKKAGRKELKGRLNALKLQYEVLKKDLGTLSNLVDESPMMMKSAKKAETLLETLEAASSDDESSLSGFIVPDSYEGEGDDDGTFEYTEEGGSGGSGGSGYEADEYSYSLKSTTRSSEKNDKGDDDDEKVLISEDADSIIENSLNKSSKVSKSSKKSTKKKVADKDDVDDKKTPDGAADGEEDGDEDDEEEDGEEEEEEDDDEEDEDDEFYGDLEWHTLVRKPIDEIIEIKLGSLEDESTEWAAWNSISTDDERKAKIEAYRAKIVVELKASEITHIDIIESDNLDETQKMETLNKLTSIEKEEEDSEQFNFKARRDLYNLIYNSKPLSDEARKTFAEEESKITAYLAGQSSIKNQIISMDTTLANKAIVYKKHLTSVALGTSEEAAKYKDFVSAALKYPWSSRHSIPRISESDPVTMNKTLAKAASVMDSRIHGLTKLKEQVLEILRKRMFTPTTLEASKQARSSVIAVQGPPGTGKTELFMSLGDALGIPIKKLALGGIDNVEPFDGHDFTYTGAQLGLLIELIQQAGSQEMIMILDEADKMGPKLAQFFLGVLDPTQNRTHRDAYLRMEYDLSNIIFVVTCNDVTKINPILLDRMKPCLTVPSPSNKDKLVTAKNFLVPRILNEFGLQGRIQFTDEAIDTVMTSSQHKEKGVRHLRSNLERIISRVTMVDNVNRCTKDETNELTLSYYDPKNKSHSELKSLRIPDARDSDPLSINRNVARLLFEEDGKAATYMTLYT